VVVVVVVVVMVMVVVIVTVVVMVMVENLKVTHDLGYLSLVMRIILKWL
jgi:hypothetical protein